MTFNQTEITAPRADAIDVRIVLLLDAIAEQADMAASCATSCREAARRGWIAGARQHAEQTRVCVIHLMQTTREALELSGGSAHG